MSTETKPTRKIYLYRKSGDRRIKFCFEVDDQFTILSETAVQETPAVVAPAAEGRVVDREAVERYVADLRNRGYIVEVNAVNGSVKVLHTPEYEKVIARFLEGKPCDFPGYTTLYKEFAYGLRDLQDKIAEGTCTNCEIGSYKRKYRDRLALILRPDASQSTRPGQAPGSEKTAAA